MNDVVVDKILRFIIKIKMFMMMENWPIHMVS